MYISANMLFRERLKEDFVLALHEANFRSRLNTEFSAYPGRNDQPPFARNVCGFHKHFLFVITSYFMKDYKALTD